MRLRRDPLRHPWLFVAIGALYAFSIPWWFGDGRPSTLLGLPSWAVVSLLCTFGVSCLVSYATLRLWDGRGDDHAGDHADDHAADHGNGHGHGDNREH